MAITATHYELMKSLPVKGESLLEIGEANWYGDLDPNTVGLKSHESLFAIAKEFYGTWFSPTRIVSIDLHGTPSAQRKDLNFPLDLHEKFDVVLNNGTAEHIFNIAQVFASMHDHCETNGWLIHDAPFHGWIDHGFYCLQPTLFYDIALVNCYEVSLVAIHETKSRTIVRLNSRDHISQLAKNNEIPMNAMLFVAFRKRVDKPFALPTQGYYAGNLSSAGSTAWETMR